MAKSNGYNTRLILTQHKIIVKVLRANCRAAIENGHEWRKKDVRENIRPEKHEEKCYNIGFGKFQGRHVLYSPI